MIAGFLCLNSSMPQFVDSRNSCLRTSSWGHLFHRALFRRLFRAPAQKLGAMTEPALVEIVIRDFADQLGVERLPFPTALRTPAAGTAGRAPAESTAFHERL